MEKICKLVFTCLDTELNSDVLSQLLQIFFFFSAMDNFTGFCQQSVAVCSILLQSSGETGKIESKYANLATDSSGFL